MSLLPPLKNTGPLTPYEREQFERLRKRAEIPPTAEVIDLDNRNAVRMQRVKVDAAWAAFDRTLADKIEEIVPQQIAQLPDGWSRQVAVEYEFREVRRCKVDAKALRAHLLKAVAHVRALMVSRLGDDPDPESEFFDQLIGPATTNALTFLVETAAQEFARGQSQRR